MKDPKDFIGLVYRSKEGVDYKILDYEGALKVYVEALDGTDYKTYIQMDNLRKGSIKNPYKPSVYDIGYVGEGPYPTVEEGPTRWRSTKCYRTWSTMLQRCFIPKQSRQSYADKTVSEDWKCFQNYAEWYHKQLYKEDDWEVDKDILVKGNKIYSADTCCFVPKEINNLFTFRSSERGDLPMGVRKNNRKYLAQLSKGCKRIGLGTYDTPEEAFNVYKCHKEAHIKELAEKWKTKLDPRVYESLINWKIESTE